MLLIDAYLCNVITDIAGTNQANIRSIYWALSLLPLIGIAISNYLGKFTEINFDRWPMLVLFTSYIIKLFPTLILLLGDIGRFTYCLYNTVLTYINEGGVLYNVIPRSYVWVHFALSSITVPIIILGYGILSGAHDYRVRRVRVVLPNLPKSFDGLRIAHISDIHIGSFFRKSQLRRGVEMLRSAKPDVVFFTGDLVNNRVRELRNKYISILKHIQAPGGVYSVLGNHDYGDYVRWPSKKAKKNNLQKLCQAHEKLGWKLLMNTNQILQRGNDKLAIIGVENWGSGVFAKYGNLKQACVGTENIPVKLLLSHDPSHWGNEVLTTYPDIDIMFSGHTHGMQFGIDLENFKWSPIQYRYKQWAGLYSKGKQYLYVNRGFGYIGFPGRIGILPEITIMSLSQK